MTYESSDLYLSVVCAQRRSVKIESKRISGAHSAGISCSVGWSVSALYTRYIRSRTTGGGSSGLGSLLANLNVVLSMRHLNPSAEVYFRPRSAFCASVGRARRSRRNRSGGIIALTLKFGTSRTMKVNCRVMSSVKALTGSSDQHMDPS